MADIPTPRFRIGDVVWWGHTTREQRQLPCPDCLGSGTWTVTTPAGATLTASCPRCGGGYGGLERLPSLNVSVLTPQARPLTIGSVRIDTGARSGEVVAYMAHETGVGSGSIYYEDTLFATKEEALARAETEAAERNAKDEAKPERIEQAHFSHLTLKDATLDAANSAIWNAWYAYRRIVEELEEEIGEQGGARTIDELREFISERLKWERDRRGQPPLGKLLARIKEAVETGNVEILRDATKHIPELAIFEPAVDTDEDAISCPVDDPDCEGGDGDCHDACERPDVALSKAMGGDGDLLKTFTDIVRPVTP